MEIINFEWSITNPDPTITVTLVEAPTLANGWVAIFNVDRTYVPEGETPPKPHVEMTWQVMGPVTYEHSIATIGDCEVSGTDTCPPQWVCMNALPTMIDGVEITPEILQSTGGLELYPNEALGCAEAALVRVCEGDGAEITEVDISEQIPVGVTTILNYGWEVVSGGVGISAEQLSPPTFDNGWIATFKTTRTDWSVTPTQPEVYLHWQVTTESTTIQIIETGDCTVTGDEFCGVEWVCTAFAPGFEPEPTEPTDPGEGPEIPTNPAEGSLGQRIVNLMGPVQGDVSVTRSVSIATSIPPGITAISNFRADVIDPPEAVVLINQLPAEDNGWEVKLILTSTPVGNPEDCSPIPLPVMPDGQPMEEDLTQQTGSPKGVAGPAAAGKDGPSQPAPQAQHCPMGRISIKLAWQNGVIVPPGGGDGDTPPGPSGPDVGGLPSLYPGAPLGCTRAELVYDCTGINGGTVCHDTAEGPICEEVIGGPFDNCSEFQQREDCELDRVVCNEDGQIEGNDHCYIEANVYICETPVMSEEIDIVETQLCQGVAVTCLDGSCTNQANELPNRRSMTRSYAMMALNQNLATDYEVTDNRPPTNPPGGSPGGPCAEDCSPQIPIGKGGPQSAGHAMPTPQDEGDGDGEGGDEGEFPGIPGLPGGIEGGGEWDPWTLPEGADLPYTNSSTTQPGIPPAGLSIEFMKGKGQTCMKALGGTLNCCTQPVKPEDANEKWWERFASMREKFAGLKACSADEDEEGGWANMQDGAGMGSFLESFTSRIENLAGGGDAPECEGDMTMKNVNDLFMQERRGEVRPNLSWYCDEDEFDLASAKEAGNCYYLGDYCQTRILGVCIDKRQRHCCFNSPMSKMIRGYMHEQGIISMGTAKDPKCDGISIMQMANIDLSRMNMNELEGRIVDSGIMPNITELLGNDIDLEDLFTGTGSLINNDGRVSLSTRTEANLVATDPIATQDSATESAEHLIPQNPTVEVRTPGEISFTQRYRTVKRGKVTRRLDIDMVRTGGDGPVSVDLVLTTNFDRAMAGDIITSPEAVRIFWADNDTRTKSYTVQIPAWVYWVYPGLTEPDQSEEVPFRFELWNPTGGATVYPTGVFDLIVKPRFCYNPNTGELDDC